MTYTNFIAAASAAFISLATPLLAGDIMIHDPYARSSTPNSVTGAAFFSIMNKGEADDRLIAASSDVAGRVELHTHTEDANGVMRMGEIEGGIPVASGGMHALKRGGDHVMLMGLNTPLVQGEEITITLTFEQAGDVVVQVPVDNERKPDHSTMKHSN